jgi:hypothetical protein
MYLYFHLGFKIPGKLYSYIFKTETRVFCPCYRAIAQTLEHFTKLPKYTYTRPEEADVTSLLNSICNFDFVVTIVIVQMCLAFKKGLSQLLLVWCMCILAVL